MLTSRKYGCLCHENMNFYVAKIISIFESVTYPISHYACPLVYQNKMDLNLNWIALTFLGLRSLLRFLVLAPAVVGFGLSSLKDSFWYCFVFSRRSVFNLYTIVLMGIAKLCQSLCSLLFFVCKYSPTLLEFSLFFARNGRMTPLQ